MDNGELQKLMAFLLETLQQGKNFTVDQAPQFVQELLAWRYYEALFFIGLGALILFFGGVCWRVMVKTTDDNLGIIAFWGGMVGTVIGVITMANFAYNVVQVSVAPRLVLVEMVRGLLR